MKSHRHRQSGKLRLPQQQRDPGNRILESTSAEGKIRGTARQLVERYLQFAEEARLANDRLASEAFLQSAEHYVRLSNPDRHPESPLVEHRPHAREPIATETCISTSNALLNDPVASVCTGQAPEPESVIVKKAPNPRQVKGREQAGIAAKRTATAAELKRVAVEHGYTLAQLELVLRPEGFHR